MVIDYSRTTSLVQAIEDTLLGEKPCARCHQLRFAQQAESKRPPISFAHFRSEIYLSAPEFPPPQFLPIVLSRAIPPALPGEALLKLPPPTPPPRQAPAFT